MRKQVILPFFCPDGTVMAVLLQRLDEFGLFVFVQLYPGKCNQLFQNIQGCVLQCASIMRKLLLVNGREY